MFAAGVGGRGAVGGRGGASFALFLFYNGIQQLLPAALMSRDVGMIDASTTSTERGIMRAVSAVVVKKLEKIRLSKRRRLFSIP
jgi:hypothetical protein